MEREIFFDRFVKSLEDLKKQYELETIHDALIVWFGMYYLSLEPDVVVERIVKDTHAEGVDAILLDEKEYNLFFIQAKTVTKFDKTQTAFSENDLKLTLSGIRFLLTGAYKGKITPKLENLVDEYHELDKTGNYKTTIVFLFLKNNPVDDKYVKEFTREFPNIEVKFCNFDSLLHFYENIYLKRRAPAPDMISFSVVGNILSKDAPYKSRIFSCRGEELAKIYNDYKERIFQQNVRFSLGLQSKSINRQILETARSDKEKKSFWYFNNGITIVCDEILETSSRKVVNLKNAQVINGAQTTYALYDAFLEGRLTSDVEILVKVIESTNKDFVGKVTLYTNSQNPIRLRDLCSEDDIQRLVQKILLDTYGYFYERKRGEFELRFPTLEHKKKRFGNYLLKLISNENAAQAFLALYLDKPAQAKSEKGRVFLKVASGFYDEIFNTKDTLLPEKILMAWKLLKYIEWHKKEYIKNYKSAEKMSRRNRTEIYRYDFLLYGEYFLLNIFKDFLQKKKLNIKTEKNDLLTIIKWIDSNDPQLYKGYKAIETKFVKYMDKHKSQPEYYHNKFFKNESSIGLLRDYFRKIT